MTLGLLLIAACGSRGVPTEEPPPQPSTVVDAGGLRLTFSVGAEGDGTADQAATAFRRALVEHGVSTVRVYRLDANEVVVDVPATVDPVQVQSLLRGVDVGGEVRFEEQSMFGPVVP